MNCSEIVDGALNRRIKLVQATDWLKLQPVLNGMNLEVSIYDWMIWIICLWRSSLNICVFFKFKTADYPCDGMNKIIFKNLVTFFFKCYDVQIPLTFDLCVLSFLIIFFFFILMTLCEYVAFYLCRLLLF